MATVLTSKRHQVQATSDPVEFCFQQGWTDGLPVVPPTADRVGAMLEAARLAPGKQIAFVEHRSVAITAEKVAINAVMAGCKPEYLPVVVAAVEGIGDPRWSYHGPGTSTGGAGVLMIVNGPIARELDINAGDNLFGPGWRANLTIGRAVRLVMRNVCGSLPGLLDRGTLGHPGKLSYVIAENEADSPWTPLHVERGFRPEQSTVTVIASEAPHQFYNQLSPTAEGVLTTLADSMRISGTVMGQSTYAVILAGEHMRTIAGSGWGKKEIRQFLFDHTKNSHAHLKRTQRMAGAIQAADETTMRPLVASPDDILVVAAGGRAGAFSAFVPGWGSAKNSQAVTKEVKR
ncbi:MAG: hypothetical protein DME07_21745 [Candidatus Rokuibacteriota bacterium]|nr:MAG: hypothetical protein DME07_21745 [Candidatus Rokubacteria bacterium]PYN56208.1 MAG: hypothetical protein DMD94_08415 [Candidatus Rokubacteria bacterium]